MQKKTNKDEMSTCLVNVRMVNFGEEPNLFKQKYFKNENNSSIAMSYEDK